MGRARTGIELGREKVGGKVSGVKAGKRRGAAMQGEVGWVEERSVRASS